MYSVTYGLSLCKKLHKKDIQTLALNERTPAIIWRAPTGGTEANGLGKMGRSHALARRLPSEQTSTGRVCRSPQLFGSSATHAFLIPGPPRVWRDRLSATSVTILSVPRIGRSRELNFGLKAWS
ncbi:hypothetical protein MES4922_410042 [Mesorhizobium ventifaucium]|uniref:Uncharacterized protein n=1 Tax=Mesorhizobium ventifaucium TaxID=666020 RepID=A0ABM9EAV3_9HYPH|nr:hypothetical protein MES4922_410042 [Mesorhizobium ventifaucium]